MGSPQDDPLKVLDFSADNDDEPDSEGEFTSATLEIGALPESFTICSAFMVDAWTTKFTAAYMFVLMDSEERIWGRINLYAASSFTEYKVGFGPVPYLVKQIEAIFFPLQWTRVCLSLDAVEGKVSLVVDGQLLGEEEYKKEEDNKRPDNFILLLGYDPYGYEETGKVTELNMFNSSLPLERMRDITSTIRDECEVDGDLVSWEEAEWTLHSQAKVIEVDREWEGPCRREPQIQVFAAEFDYHTGCMEHCQKIATGRSPAVTTEEEWMDLMQELILVTPDRSILPNMWLSATEGDKNRQLAILDHWPETEVFNNETLKLNATETIWRDFYTGQRLKDWEKPYFGNSKQGQMIRYGENYNCIALYTDEPLPGSWYEWQCISYDKSCPCIYSGPALLRLRGRCSSLFNDPFFYPKQLPSDPLHIIMVGTWYTRIGYNDDISQWMLTSAKYNVTAVSQASHVSYVLGKHEWTISNDTFECGKGESYTTELKLTGCKEDGEFTCDDGQCVTMEERCNQVPDCRDKSDERGCQLIALEDGYNKNIPPIARAKDGSAIPADVSISITLMKVVDIEETEHSIHLQFQVSLMWKENRVKYRNLKKETSLNALTEIEIRTIWRPLIVYDNTDQKEVARLGMEWEWSTEVTVTREGDFYRSGFAEVDEAEIFEGAENGLTMNQTYTWEFQCQYELQRYPFDTQVQIIKYDISDILGYLAIILGL